MVLAAPLLAAVLTLSASAGRSTERAYALLSDNRLVEFAVPSGRVVARVRLGTKPEGYVTEGQFVASSAQDHRLFVLVQTGRGADWVAVLDSRTARLRARYQLEGGVRYRGIRLAGDLLYAYGGRFGREVDTTNHAREESAVVTQLDAASGATRATLTVRPAEGHSWWLYWASVRPDGSQIALSYHGGCYPESISLCTSGADLVDVKGASLQPCESRSSRFGCLRQVHGMIEPYGVGWIAATGGEGLLQYGSHGNVLRLLHTGIRRDHLMDFAFNATRNRLYVLGACGSGGGLRRVSLLGGRATLIRANACGDGLAVGKTAFIVRRGDTIELRSLRTAKLLRTRQLDAQIQDVVVARS